MIILVLLMLLIPVGVDAQRTKLTHTAIQVNDTLTLVLNANNNRNYLLLQNDSDSDIYCMAVTSSNVGGIIGFFGVGFFVTQFWPNGYWDMSVFSQIIVPHQGLLVRRGGPDVMFDYKFTSAAVNCIAGAPGKTILATEGVQ